MTLDQLIEKALEAKEHCVPGNTEVNVYFKDVFTLNGGDKFVGKLYDIDYDKKGINLYYDEL